MRVSQSRKHVYIERETEQSVMVGQTMRAGERAEGGSQGGGGCEGGETSEALVYAIKADNSTEVNERYNKLNEFDE